MNMTDFILCLVFLYEYIFLLFCLNLRSLKMVQRKSWTDKNIWWICGSLWPLLRMAKLWGVFLLTPRKNINCIPCQKRLRDLSLLAICRKRMFHKLNYDTVNMKHNHVFAFRVYLQLFPVFQLTRCVVLSCSLVVDFIATFWLITAWVYSC